MKPKDGQPINTGPNASERDKRALRAIRQQAAHPPVGDKLRPELQEALLDAADKMMNEGIPLFEMTGKLCDLLGGNFDYRGRMLRNHSAAEDAVFQFVMCLHSRLDEMMGRN